MKRYIRSSTYSTLQLAKGIILLSHYAGSDSIVDRIEVRSPIVHTAVLQTSPEVILIYTSCEFDPVSRDIVSGELLSHSEILDSTNLETFPHMFSMAYFSVELSTSGTSTELQLSGNFTHRPSIILLKEFFNVDDHAVADSSSFEWMDIRSPQFVTLFDKAAEHAKSDLASSVSSYSNLDRSTLGKQYSVPYFALCFAVINKQTKLGIVSVDPYLIQALSYEEYKRKAAKFAEEAGVSESDLVFKSVYNALSYANDGLEDYSAAQEKCATELARALKQEPDMTARRSSNGVNVTYFRDKERLGLTILFSDTVLEPTYKEGTHLVYVPEGFQCNAEFCDDLRDIFESYF